MAQQPQREKTFWDDFELSAPGLFGAGLGIYGQRREQTGREKLLRRAQGPLYDQQQALAGKSLALAGSMDPKAAAAERFAAQQGLVAPSNEAEMNNLMQMLQKNGLLGLSSYSAVPGTAQTPGQPVNPYVASLLAAQAGAKSKSAFQSLEEGEQQLDRLVNRSGALQGGAQGAQAANLRALSAAQIPARKAGIGDILTKGGLKILQDPRARGQVWDYAKKIPGLFSGLFGGGGGSTWGDNPEY